MSDSDITRTELYKTMMASRRYTKEEAIDTIEDMRNDVLNGSDPEEVLHEEGFEPDYIFDIMP